MSEEPTRRLFFALWPEDGLRGPLHAMGEKIARRAGGRVVAAEKLHATLVFLGNMPESSMACIREAAAGVHAEAFELSLDRTGYWPRPRVSWAGCAEMPPALPGLVRDLSTALRPCGYRPERRPFHVHVTLTRKTRHHKGEESMRPLPWPVADFCLVESVSEDGGVSYLVLDRWPLKGPARD